MGGEKLSWRDKKEKYKEDILRISGDSLLCGASIAYLGPFIISYRDECVQQWIEHIQKTRIEFSDKFTIQEVLCDEKTIGQWVSQ